MLKAPYSWIVDNAGTRKQGLELTWTLDFEGRGRQGRVRAKVKKFEAETNNTGRTLRSRHVPPANEPRVDEDEDEADDDYDALDYDEDSSEEDSDEGDSEFIEPSRR